MLWLLVPLLSVIPVANSLVAKDNVGKLPAMGWNSWNAYNCNITEAHFLSAAQKIIDLGLKVLSLHIFPYLYVFSRSIY